MNFEILIGNDVYYVDDYLRDFAVGDNVLVADKFTGEELAFLSQTSFFCDEKLLVLKGKLDAKPVQKLLKAVDDDVTGTIYYVPGYFDKREKLFKLNQYFRTFNKLDHESLVEAIVLDARTENVSVTDEAIAFLIDYSEYLFEDAISYYDILNCIRAVTGSELTVESIMKNFIRSEKDDAFKLLSLLDERKALTEYMNRLKSNPHNMIGALLYGLRVMTKLKYQDQDLGANHYHISNYKYLSNKFPPRTLVTAMGKLNEIRNLKESKEVLVSLILSVLLDLNACIE